MTTQTLMDDYEKHLRELVKEVEKYRDTGATLREMTATLQRIGTANSQVGSTVGKLSTDLKLTLDSLHDLHLDELEARNAEHFVTHGRALDQVSNDIKAVVQEQQRMALESLQRSTTLQKQFDALGAELQLALNSLTAQTTLVDQRITETRQGLNSLSDRMQANYLATEKAQVFNRNLLILLVVLVIVLGVAGLVW
jgi:Na+/phosphate symporter